MKLGLISLLAVCLTLGACASNQISAAEKQKLEQERAQAQKAAAEKSHQELDRATR